MCRISRRSAGLAACDIRSRATSLRERRYELQTGLCHGGDYYPRLLDLVTLFAPSIMTALPSMTASGRSTMGWPQECRAGAGKLGGRNYVASGCQGAAAQAVGRDETD